MYVLCFCFRVLDNLKDYTVKALVNAVDHLGTVASKLTDLFDQQSCDVLTMEMRASCVNQVNEIVTQTFCRETFLRFVCVFCFFVSNCLRAGLI